MLRQRKGDLSMAAFNPAAPFLRDPPTLPRSKHLAGKHTGSDARLAAAPDGVIPADFRGRRPGLTDFTGIALICESRWRLLCSGILGDLFGNGAPTAWGEFFLYERFAAATISVIVDEALDPAECILGGIRVEILRETTPCFWQRGDRGYQRHLTMAKRLELRASSSANWSWRRGLVYSGQ